MYIVYGKYIFIQLKDVNLFMKSFKLFVQILEFHCKIIIVIIV